MYRFSRFGTVLGVVLFLSLGALAGRWYLQHEPRSAVPATASHNGSTGQVMPVATPPLETPAPPPSGETTESAQPQKARGEERAPDPTPRGAGDSSPPPAPATTNRTEEPALPPRTETTRSQPGTVHPHPKSPAPRPVTPPGSRTRMDASAPAPGDNGVPKDPDDPASPRPTFSPKVLRTLFQKRLEALRYLE